MSRRNNATEENKEEEKLKITAENKENNTEKLEDTEEIKTDELENTEEIKEEDTPEEYVSVRKKPWFDFEDNNYQYKQGDKYPRDGYVPTKERIKMLFDYRENKLGEVLIVKKKDLEEE